MSSTEAAAGSGRRVRPSNSVPLLWGGMERAFDIAGVIPLGLARFDARKPTAPFGTKRPRVCYRFARTLVLESVNESKIPPTAVADPMDQPAVPAADSPFANGSGEMAGRVRELDWAKTPLGPPERWSPALKMGCRPGARLRLSQGGALGSGAGADLQRRLPADPG